jgi:hypothetical protein
MPKQIDAFRTRHRTPRLTVTLPAETAQQLERIARRMRVSQGALLAELLAEPVKAMASIIDLVPEVGAGPDDVRRAKGRSIEVIHMAVSQAKQLLATVRAPQAVQRPEPQKVKRRGRKR